jgi:hypothetical protein
MCVYLVCVRARVCSSVCVCVCEEEAEKGQRNDYRCRSIKLRC